MRIDEHNLDSLRGLIAALPDELTVVKPGRNSGAYNTVRASGKLGRKVQYLSEKDE